MPTRQTIAINPQILAWEQGEVQHGVPQGEGKYRRLSVIEELETTVAANLQRAERLRQPVLARAFAV